VAGGMPPRHTGPTSSKAWAEPRPPGVQQLRQVELSAAERARRARRRARAVASQQRHNQRPAAQRGRQRRIPHHLATSVPRVAQGTGRWA